MIKCPYNVPVAQLDRALVCGTKGCRFDSDQVRGQSRYFFFLDTVFSYVF